MLNTTFRGDPFEFTKLGRAVGTLAQSQLAAQYFRHFDWALSRQAKNKRGPILAHFLDRRQPWFAKTGPVQVVIVNRGLAVR